MYSNIVIHKPISFDLSLSLKSTSDAFHSFEPIDIGLGYGNDKPNRWMSQHNLANNLWYGRYYLI
jgi:hypothetical protein